MKTGNKNGWKEKTNQSQTNSRLGHRNRGECMMNLGAKKQHDCHCISSRSSPWSLILSPQPIGTVRSLLCFFFLFCFFFSLLTVSTSINSFISYSKSSLSIHVHVRTIELMERKVEGWRRKGWGRRSEWAIRPQSCAVVPLRMILISGEPHLGTSYFCPRERSKLTSDLIESDRLRFFLPSWPDESQEMSLGIRDPAHSRERIKPRFDTWTPHKSTVINNRNHISLRVVKHQIKSDVDRQSPSWINTDDRPTGPPHQTPHKRIMGGKTENISLK